MTILGSSRSITFSSSKPYSSDEGGMGAPRPVGMACDAPGGWRLGGRHARFLVDFCERYRLDALCACFLKLLAGGGAWLAFCRWVEEMAFCSSSRRVLSGMSSRSSSRNMSSSIFAVRWCRAHHHACWRAVVRVASSLTCQSTMVIMACIGADYLCRSAAHQSWTSESKPGSLGASQAPAKCAGRACPWHVIVQQRRQTGNHPPIPLLLAWHSHSGRTRNSLLHTPLCRRLYLRYRHALVQHVACHHSPPPASGAPRFRINALSQQLPRTPYPDEHRSLFEV